MKTMVIYHSSDWDGIFCREITRKFLPDAELIGWDFGDEPLPLHGYPADQRFYVLDLPVDRVFGFDYSKSPNQPFFDPRKENVVWLDHHKSAIKSHPQDIPGYRIDGVAACRLAWQFFSKGGIFKSEFNLHMIPNKQDFIDLKVSEPLAVRLAGVYDVFDKTDPELFKTAELFQHGLRSEDINYKDLLSNPDFQPSIARLLNQGKAIQYARDHEYAEVINNQGFDLQWEGLTWLACNSHELDIRSQLFEAGIKPHHDGLLGFTWTGKHWRVSIYGVPGKPEIDFSKIAVRHGGGGHKQSCGFTCAFLPFYL